MSIFTAYEVREPQIELDDTRPVGVRAQLVSESNQVALCTYILRMVSLHGIFQLEQPGLRSKQRAKFPSNADN